MLIRTFLGLPLPVCPRSPSWSRSPAICACTPAGASLTDPWPWIPRPQTDHSAASASLRTHEAAVFSPLYPLPGFQDPRLHSFFISNVISNQPQSFTWCPCQPSTFPLPCAESVLGDPKPSLQAQVLPFPCAQGGSHSLPGFLLPVLGSSTCLWSGGQDDQGIPLDRFPSLRHHSPGNQCLENCFVNFTQRYKSVQW